jgi:hypothetical protein
MKSILILTPAAGLALAALGLAAQAWIPLAQDRLQPLRRDAPVLDPSAQDQDQSKLEVDGWKAQLAEKDLDLREQAFERAVRAARMQPELREALERWAADSSAPDLAWTSRLILREAQSSSQPFGGVWALPNSQWGLSGRPQFDLQGLFGQMEDLNGNLDQLFEQLDHGQGIPIQPQGGSSRSESFQLQTGPDGVECEVTREVDGEQVTETYRADSIEQLLEQHPELKDKIQVQGLGSLGGNFGLGFPQGSMGGMSGGPQFRWLGPNSGAGRWDFSAPRSPQRTDILGVLVEPVPAERASALGLEEGLGLSVQRVEPGTIADVLGVRRGHVLIALDGKPLKTREDISTALGARAPEAELELELIDRWGERRTRTWKPEEAPAAEPRALTPGSRRF